MGAKLKAKDESSFAHMDVVDGKDINLQNWRALREWSHEKVDGLFVVIKTFRMYFIPGWTMDMLHEANYCNKTLNVPYQYIKNVLSCEFCNGDGKSDWVEAARGPSPKKQTYGYRPEYHRSRKGPVHLISVFIDESDYYASSPHLTKGEEICKKCLGSGLQLVANWAWDTKHVIYLDHS